MSSSQPYHASSPFSPGKSRSRRSRFTYKHLAQLELSSTACPLRVIAHIDLDAFYAQCEMVRLGVPEDQPLAVQQWQGLIAINYPARKYGLNRHVTITEAQKACPEIIMQHVATWREGDSKWQYHDDAFKNIATHKVSLDPYRLQSRRILALIKRTLPEAPLQRVEKASVDEVFVDLSAQVHQILLDRYPQLKLPAPYDDPTENLPAPPTTALDWNADALVDLDEKETEEDAPDWDDVAMLIGSEIVRDLRAKVREELKYTCSAGVARNKMLAKLGSGHKKPNQQTIVRNRATTHFLSGFKFTKIRNLGGKLGEEVVSMFNTDEVKDLLEVPIEQLKKLGDDTGSWLYQIIRGEDNSEVNSRTQIKSMLSAKSFRPSINSFDLGVKWLRIFVADIFSRLVEEGVLENKRRPRTINLHHRQGAQTRSKQAPIPQGRTIDEGVLFDLAKNLLAQVVVDGRAWPCGNLSLSVGGFEDGVTGNRGIGGFLVWGDEAKTLHNSAARGSDDVSSEATNNERPEKRRRVDDGRINDFFNRQETSYGTGDEADDIDDIPSAQKPDELGNEHSDEVSGLPQDPSYEHNTTTTNHEALPFSSSGGGAEANSNEKENTQPTLERFFCSRCQKSLLKEQEGEHEDWHFARDLQKQDEAPTIATSRPPSRPPSSTKPKPTKSKGRPLNVVAKEKGQSQLAFGK
ncbi:MAG: DNA-directed DNA polymerase eta rad30 [Chrysothrix sp. TS-e1954]|nr:MAG: DNA-directed DNA polymerase eta rad30 [Chrysothrix sp. TS-e1954]